LLIFKSTFETAIFVRLHILFINYKGIFVYFAVKLLDIIKKHPKKAPVLLIMENLTIIFAANIIATSRTNPIFGVSFQ